MDAMFAVINIIKVLTKKLNVHLEIVNFPVAKHALELI